MPLDPVALVFTISFVVAALSIIPLDKRWVRRQNERRRNQARRVR